MSDYLGRIITKNPQPPSPNSASGVWTLDEALQYSKAGKWPPGFQISRSVRLRSSASAYFSRAQTTGNTQKATWSGWIKRGTLTTGSYSTLFNAGTANTDAIVWNSTGDTLRIWLFGGTGADLITTQQFRDPSAWYHIVVAIDTTQATASNRILLYVNGVQVTAFTTATYPTQNYTFTKYNTSGQDANLGGIGASYFFDGYMTEVNWIDGQALTPNSFGYADTATGVWQPLPYTGTYGNNGFYLTFADNSSNTATTIGKDYSGNGNNWTPNNISVTSGSTYDSMVDVPINWGTDTGVGGEARGNYCTFNPLAVTSVAATFAEANLKVTTGLAGGNGYGTFAIPSSGKWYWEITAGSSNKSMIGICDYLSTQVYAWQNGNSVFYYNDGQKYVDGTGSSYGATYTTNDVIGVAVDAGAGTLTFYKNNTSQGSITHAVANLYPCVADGASGTTDTFYANFGQRAFAYTAPSGYKALCTQNLPVPTILNGANYMAATLYTGSGSTQSISNAVNNISFQPDFVWVKDRTSAQDHKLTDSVRGTTKGLISDTTGAETTDANGVTAFNSNGFSLGTGTRSYSDSNADSYVGWQWLAGKGTTSSNTSGSITSTVSINATAGFSIVTYTGNGTVGATVGHGLGVTPGMVIVKNRSAAADWPVKILPYMTGGQRLELNTTNATTTEAAGSGSVWNATNPSSTVITLGNIAMSNTNTNTYVAYCFAAISGYSAFGSYTGNGSTDGPFVYCGFRPRFVLFRSTAARNWVIRDTSRNTYNAVTNDLYPDLSSAEYAAGDAIDILSNGFKLRATGATFNGSGETYIYAAFAENPFTIARAR